MDRVSLGRSSVSSLAALAISLGIPVSAGNAQSNSQVGVTANAPAEKTPPLRNSISVLGGAMAYKQGSHGHYPYFSLRLGRDFSRYFAGELGLGYASAMATEFSGPTFQEVSFDTPVVTADLALHAMLPIKAFVPYVGVSGGTYRRFDSRNGINPGVEITGTSVGVLAGSKIHFGELFGLRGELRIRGDRNEGARVRSANAEYSLGMIFRF